MDEPRDDASPPSAPAEMGALRADVARLAAENDALRKSECSMRGEMRAALSGQSAARVSEAAARHSEAAARGSEAAARGGEAAARGSESAARESEVIARELMEVALRSREVLRRSEERLQLFVTASTELIYRMNADWSVMLSLEGKAIVASAPEPTREWMKRYLPVEEIARVRAAIGEAIRRRGNFELEHRCYGADGQILWVFSRAVPLFDENGNIAEWFGAAADVTAKREAEEALRKSEARYRGLFESIDEGFCIIEMLFDESGKAHDYRFLEANPAFAKQTGIADAVGRTIREFAPGHESLWFELYGRVAQTGESIRFQQEARAIGRYYDVYAFRMGTPGQNQVAVLFQDIGERVTQENRQKFLLQLSDELRREESADGVAGRVVKMLAEFLALDLAYAVALLPEKDRALVTHQAHAETMPPLPPTLRLSDFPESFKRMMERTLVFEDMANDSMLTNLDRRCVAAMDLRGVIAAPVRRGTGNPIWCLVAACRDPRKWTRGEVSLMEEVAERTWTALQRAEAEEALRASEERSRRAEERLRLIVDSALEHAIITLDRKRCITSWNPGAEAIFRYRAEEAINQTGDITFTPEDRAADIPGEEMRAALEKGRAGDDRWMQHKDGTRFWANGAMLPMREHQDGEVIGFVKILRDETSVREAQLALEESREQLWEALQENERAREIAEAARKAKDHFLAVLSHELRTPLTPVLMAVRTLKRLRELPPVVERALDMIERNVALEAHFIDDLLDLTRIERGKMELQFRDLDVHEVLRRAVEVCRADFEGKSLRFTLALDAAEHEVSGDETRLQQVIWNLLKNAAKFTPEKGSIELRTRNEAGCIVISVTDSGIGFGAEAAARIFDSFGQADSEITRRYGGLGLGLAIAKACVEGHSGKLRGESPGPDHGATFTVELPLLSAPTRA